MNHLDMNFEADILMEQLKKLNQEDRVLIGLYFYERLTLDEMSIVLEQSNEVLRKRLTELIPMLKLRPVTNHNYSETQIEMFG
ncbi:MAG: hypothetical protein Kow0037_23600 [Calditrichia bacterium]